MARKVSPTMAIFGTILVIAVVVLIYAVFFRTSQTGLVNPNGGSTVGTYISTGATAFTFSTYDEATKTNVTSSSIVRIGDTGPFLAGITSASPGNNIFAFLSAPGYHTVYTDKLVLPSSPTSYFPIAMKGNGTVLIDVWNTNNVIMANAGAGTNQTAQVGGVYNHQIRLTGSSNKDTGDMECILEAENGSAVQRIELTGLGAVAQQGVGKPQFYTLLSSSSAVWVFDISPIVGPVTPMGNMVVTTANGKTTAGTRVKVTCFTKENFVDPNTGLPAYDIQDSNGLQKSINAPTTSFYYN